MRDQYEDRTKELENETALRHNAEYLKERATEGLDSKGKETDEKDSILKAYNNEIIVLKSKNRQLKFDNMELETKNKTQEMDIVRLKRDIKNERGTEGIISNMEK